MNRDIQTYINKLTHKNFLEKNSSSFFFENTSYIPIVLLIFFSSPLIIILLISEIRQVKLYQFLDPSRKTERVLSNCHCQYVRVEPTRFLKNGSQDFSEFYLKLDALKGHKLAEPKFSEKFLFWRKNIPPKQDFFDFVRNLIQ